MSIPGQLSVPGGVTISPIWLYRNLVDIFSLSFIDAWIGDQLILDTSGNVDKWPSMSGYNLLSNSSSNRFILGLINNRKALYSAAPAGKSLRANSVIVPSYVKTFITLVTMPSLPFSDYPSVIVTNVGMQAITGYAGNSALYPSQSIDRYVDCVLTDTVSPGIHMIEASNAGVVSRFCVGGIDGYYAGYPGRDWAAKIGCVIALSAQPNDSQRLATKKIFNRYYDSTSF